MKVCRVTIIDYSNISQFLSKPIFSARRRRQNNMLPMMLLGLTAFGVFTVPMGFQFILILCGKAVLLSKMALLLSSINGSRRVFYNFCKKKKSETVRRSAGTGH